MPTGLVVFAATGLFQGRIVLLNSLDRLTGRAYKDFSLLRNPLKIGLFQLAERLRSGSGW
ncbi:hypothetical protein D9M68_912170 [compost metagenome]